MIDLDAIAQLRGLPGDNGVDLLTELIDLFTEHAPATLTRLRAAVASGVAQDAARQAHALTGSSLTLGATAIVSLARRMEALAHDGSLDALPALADEIDTLLPPTIAALRAL